MTKGGAGMTKGGAGMTRGRGWDDATGCIARANVIQEYHSNSPFYHYAIFHFLSCQRRLASRINLALSLIFKVGWYMDPSLRWDDTRKGLG